MTQPPLLEYPSSLGPIQPLNGRAKAAIITLTIAVVTMALFGTLQTWVVATGRLYNPTPGAPPAAPTADQLIALMITGGSACLYLLAFAISIVFYCLWIYRASANMHGMGTPRLKHTPGWAVGYWFIPIVNWYKPYAILRELWQSSAPEESPDGLWEKNPVSSALTTWILLWLLNSIIGVVNMILGQVAGPAYQSTVNLISCIALLPNLLSGICMILFVQKLTARIENKRQTFLAESVHNQTQMPPQTLPPI